MVPRYAYTCNVLPAPVITRNLLFLRALFHGECFFAHSHVSVTPLYFKSPSPFCFRGVWYSICIMRRLTSYLHFWKLHVVETVHVLNECQRTQHDISMEMVCSDFCLCRISHCKILCWDLNWWPDIFLQEVQNTEYSTSGCVLAFPLFFCQLVRWK